MKKGRKNTFRLLSSSLFDNFFKILYFIVNFLIFIGDLVKGLVKIILTGFISSLKFLIKKLTRIKKPKVSLPKIRFRAFENLTIKIRFFIFGSLLTLIAVFIYQSYFFVSSLPSPQNIGKVNFPLTSHIYDRNGKLLYEVYRDQNRTPVSIKDLPNYIKNATIAIEDKEFYKHNGVSLVGGILRAFKDTAVQGNLQGGSTITQQLVKSSLLTSERTIERKIKEIILALWTERLFSKDQILEMYLNGRD